MRSHGGLAAIWLIIACFRPCSMQTYTSMQTPSMRCGASVVTSQRKSFRKSSWKTSDVCPSRPTTPSLAAALPSPNVRSSSAHRVVGTCTTHVELPCSSSASAAMMYCWAIATQLCLPYDPVFTPLVPIVRSPATPDVWAWPDSATCFPIRTQSASPLSARKGARQHSQPVSHWLLMGPTHVWPLAALHGRLSTASHPHPRFASDLTSNPSQC